MEQRILLRMLLARSCKVFHIRRAYAYKKCFKPSTSKLISSQTMNLSNQMHSLLTCSCLLTKKTSVFTLDCLKTKQIQTPSLALAAAPPKSPPASEDGSWPPVSSVRPKPSTAALSAGTRGHHRTRQEIDEKIILFAELCSAFFYSVIK